MSDLIRRADAMRVIKDDWDASFSREDVERAEICRFHFIEISNIPTAEPKVGKWFDHSDEGYVECPFCGSLTTCDDNIDELHYCFNCGSRMRGEKDE